MTLSAREGPERLTCDIDVELACRGKRARLRRGLVLVESKSESGAGPADRVLAEMNLEPVSLSKYKVGIAMLVGRSGSGGRDASQDFFV